MIEKTVDMIKNFAQENGIELNIMKNSFWVRQGSAVILIFVECFDNYENLKDEVVTFYCRVVENAKIDAKLIEKLLRLNAEFKMGSFGLTQDNAICYRHSILGGRHMDFEEFYTALASVAFISDEYDDKIISTNGGKTAIDTLVNTSRMKDIDW